jgi:tyrosyl-tRNA synthetase
MGGSDQWGNITSGTEFIRRNVDGGKAYAVTTPLLTKSDGTKFGKSSEGNIWLDPKLTSPYKFYQYWLKSDDRDLPKFMRYFSFKTKEEILALEETYKEDSQTLKKLFAEEITKQVHGDFAFKSAQMVSELVFNKKLNEETLQQMSGEDLEAISHEIPSKALAKSLLDDGSSVVDLLVGNAEIFESNSALRRAVKGNALALNKVKVQDFEKSIGKSDLLQNQYLLIENGKKEKYLIVFK